LADSDFERKNTEWGWFGPYNKNEVAIVSNVGDPPMLWLASESGMSLGSITFGRTRPDGKLEALVLFQGKQDERTRDLTGPAALTGEFTLHIRNGAAAPGDDDKQFIKIIEARHDGVWICGKWFGFDGSEPDVPPSVEPPTQPPVVTPPAPVEPPPPAHKYVAGFHQGGKWWEVEAGDFFTLKNIFGFDLDRSEKEEYYRLADSGREREGWDAIVALYKRKDSSNS
jgi:hypothetical protein